jgi:hypothetical protein
VEQVCRRRTGRPPTVENLGFLTGRPSGQRPWMALATDSERLHGSGAQLAARAIAPPQFRPARGP